jgi:iron complex outermembrane recepter protein
MKSIHACFSFPRHAVASAALTSLAVAAVTLSLPALAQTSAEAEPSTAAADSTTKSLGVVTVNSGQPTSLPTQIPTTMEGITREQIEQTINATDSEDALKYLPSLLVRKRYIGDYNHAILSSRASGTGNSARSAVYADGILLSNYLGNGVGGLSFPPRWGLVTPEEIERVDVMYGPFSAAYPGNSVGAVVDYVTRMPSRFEAHGKIDHVRQPFALYSTNQTFTATQASASLGNKNGDWSWWINANHTDSHGQPLTFPTRVVSTGTPGNAGTAVNGAILDRNNANAPWYILGTGTEYHTTQDHLKIKVAYDITPTLRAAYTLGYWQNKADGDSVSYLRNAAGQPVYSGPVNIDGRSFTLNGGDFALTRENLSHVMHGLSVKSHTKGEWDWEAAASLYGYNRDLKRQNGAANPLPAAARGGAGTIADGGGTGWTTLALKGTWRPQGVKGAHIADFGMSQDSYKLRYRTSNIAGNWLADGTGSLAGNASGDTQLQSLYAQDAWAFAPKWKAVLGGRAERWTARNGQTQIPGATPALDTSWPKRNESFFSPKGALSYQWVDDTVLKASVGRAIRFPTVSELYGATAPGLTSQFLNDPNLKPEKSWTTELTAEKDMGSGLLRLTFFAENTRDALYSQSQVNPLNSSQTITTVQNVGRIATKGLEAAYNGFDVGMKGLDLGGSITYADSIIKENSGFVATPGDTLGKQQPNIPRWRATALASYRFNPQWSATLGARYSGTQYRTLNNADVNGYTYQGVSKYFTADARLRYQVTKAVTAAFGIENINNYKYWNFHPYPQRSYVAELKLDL